MVFVSLLIVVVLSIKLVSRQATSVYCSLKLELGHVVYGPTGPAMHIFVLYLSL
jgi:hypothetical protein